MSRERRGRPLSGHEEALWQEAMREVAPLRAQKPRRKKREAPAPERKDGRLAVAEKLSEAAHKPQRPKPAPKPSEPAPHAQTGVDGALARRMRRGEIDIDARLDLHGLTQQEAHHALTVFIERSVDAGRRCLLLITGKGGGAEGGEGRGILKGLAPRWLRERPLAERIAAITPAHRRHGGGGALYIYLRRRR